MTQKIAWVTGASTGIGAETVRELVRQGWVVAGTARTAEKLDTLKSAIGKSFHAYPGDVTDTERMHEIVQSIEQDIGPIELVVLNAGSADLENGDFSLERFEWHFQVNVFGTVRALDPVMKTMLQRGRGHVAIVASVAGYRGLPRSLSYGPTKAALINFAEALKITMAQRGLKVQVINPGFVDTPLTRKNDFHMPMLMPVDRAAKKLVKGLSKDRFEIVFPWFFVFMLKLITLLPDKLYFWMVSRGLESAMKQKK